MNNAAEYYAIVWEISPPWDAEKAGRYFPTPQKVNPLDFLADALRLFLRSHGLKCWVGHGGGLGAGGCFVLAEDRERALVLVEFFRQAQTMLRDVSVIWWWDAAEEAMRLHAGTMENGQHAGLLPLVRRFYQQMLDESKGGQEA